MSCVIPLICRDEMKRLLLTFSPVSELVMGLCTSNLSKYKIFFHDTLAKFRYIFIYIYGNLRVFFKRSFFHHHFLMPSLGFVQFQVTETQPERERESEREGETERKRRGSTLFLVLCNTKITNWIETRRLITKCCFVLQSKHERQTAGQPGKTC